MEVKKLDGGNCWTFDIAYTTRYKIHGDEFIGTTEGELSGRLNKHRYDTKNTPDKNELAVHMHKYQHKILISKENLH